MFTIRDKQNRLVAAKGGGPWEFGISRCKLVYTERINNKVLLFSIENYIRYPMINQNGKEYEKEYIYIGITESLCCTAVMNTLQFNYTSIKHKLKKKNIYIHICGEKIWNDILTMGLWK